MNDLRHGPIGQFVQPDLSTRESTVFRYYKLEKNQLFKVDNKEFVHFFFLIEGEIRVSGIKSTKSVITSKEFFFIPNSRFICRSIKESQFILFSINRFHYQANKIMYADIIPVIMELREHHSPLTIPPLLSMFVEILADYLNDSINSELLQKLKQKELFIILSSLYQKRNENDIPMYGRVSLS